MEAPVTKASLQDELVLKRAEFDAALAAVPVERMTLPGAAGLWSVKDIIAHMALDERWLVDRMDEVRRGVVYSLTELDTMDAYQRNYIEYQQFRDVPLEQALAESRQAFQDLLAALRPLDEAALFTPRQFHGASQPVTLHGLLRSKVIDHYGEHIPSLQRMANP